jgi:hypothetical protein
MKSAAETYISIRKRQYSMFSVPRYNNGAAFIPEYLKPVLLVRKMARLSPCRFKMADKKNYKKPVKYKKCEISSKQQSSAYKS